MYSGPINPTVPESNSVESIIETGVKITSHYNANANNELLCEVFRFNHNLEGDKYAVIFYDGSEPCDFTALEDADNYAEDAALTGYRM